MAASSWLRGVAIVVVVGNEAVAAGARTEWQRSGRVGHDLVTWIERGVRRDLSSRRNGSTRQLIGW